MNVNSVALTGAALKNLSADELKKLYKDIDCQTAECKNSERKKKTRLVWEFDSNETNKLIMIHRKQEELESVKENIEKKIEAVESEIDRLQKEISDEILKNIKDTTKASEKKKDEIKKAIKKVTGLYVGSKGKLSKEEAKILLSKELRSINIFLPALITDSLYSSSSKISDLRLKINLMSELGDYNDAITREISANNAYLNAYYNSDNGIDTVSFATNPISLCKIKTLGNMICYSALNSMHSTANSILDGENTQIRMLESNGVYEIKKQKEYESSEKNIA